MARNGDTRVAPARAKSLREAGWRKAPGARLQDCAGSGGAAGPDRRRAGGRAARRRCRRLRHTAPRARRTATGKTAVRTPGDSAAATTRTAKRLRRATNGGGSTADNARGGDDGNPSGGRGSQWPRPCAGVVEKTVASVPKNAGRSLPGRQCHSCHPSRNDNRHNDRRKRSDHRPRQRTDGTCEQTARANGKPGHTDSEGPAKPAGTSESATYTPMRPKESADLRIFTRTCVWRNLSKPTTVVRLGRTYREGPT